MSTRRIRCVSTTCWNPRTLQQARLKVPDTLFSWAAATSRYADWTARSTAPRSTHRAFSMRSRKPRIHGADCGGFQAAKSSSFAMASNRGRFRRNGCGSGGNCGRDHNRQRSPPMIRWPNASDRSDRCAVHGHALLPLPAFPQEIPDGHVGGPDALLASPQRQRPMGLPTMVRLSADARKFGETRGHAHGFQKPTASGNIRTIPAVPYWRISSGPMMLHCAHTSKSSPWDWLSRFRHAGFTASLPFQTTPSCGRIMRTIIKAFALNLQMTTH